MPKQKDVPQFFRLNIEVGNLDAAIDFYTKLLDISGRKQPGSRDLRRASPDPSAVYAASG